MGYPTSSAFAAITAPSVLGSYYFPMASNYAEGD
jgi:hypothetical protein